MADQLSLAVLLKPKAAALLKSLRTSQSSLRLHDVQRIVARAYGMRDWHQAVKSTAWSPANVDEPSRLIVQRAEQLLLEAGATISGREIELALLRPAFRGPFGRNADFVCPLYCGDGRIAGIFLSADACYEHECGPAGLTDKLRLGDAMRVPPGNDWLRVAPSPFPAKAQLVPDGSWRRWRSETLPLRGTPRAVLCLHQWFDLPAGTKACDRACDGWGHHPALMHQNGEVVATEVPQNWHGAWSHDRLLISANGHAAVDELDAVHKACLVGNITLATAVTTPDRSTLFRGLALLLHSAIESPAGHAVPAFRLGSLPPLSSHVLWAMKLRRLGTSLEVPA